MICPKTLPDIFVSMVCIMSFLFEHCQHFPMLNMNWKWGLCPSEKYTKRVLYRREFQHSISKHAKDIQIVKWRHNGRIGVSNHQPHDCLLNSLFRRRSKKYQRSASLAFVRGIHWWTVNSPHNGSVTRNMFPFDDVKMKIQESLACDLFDSYSLVQTIPCRGKK